MKKLKFLFMAIALIPVLSFVACSDDGGEEIGDLKTEIVNKWNYQEIDFELNSAILNAIPGIKELALEMIAEYLPFTSGSTVEFKSNGDMAITKGTNPVVNGTYIATETTVTTTIEEISAKYEGKIISNILALSLDKNFFVQMVEEFLPPSMDAFKEQILNELKKDGVVQFSILFKKV